MENHIVEDGAVIHIDPNPDQGFNLNNFNLVGKIISDKEFGLSSIKSGLMEIWGNPNGVGRNTILINFNDHEKGKQILNRGPWSCRGHLINLNLWTRLQPIDSINHNIMELWMPLPTGIWLPRPNLPRGFKYERVQDNYCLRFRGEQVASNSANGGSKNPNSENQQSTDDQMDRTTNHEVKGMESLGENLTTVPDHSSLPEQGSQHQTQGMRALNQQHQQPAKSNNEFSKDTSTPKASCSVNQHITHSNRGKEKRQHSSSDNQEPKQNQEMQKQEGMPTNQMPITEVLKQAFINKINNFVNQKVLDPWSYREKLKMLKIWDGQGRKKIMRKSLHIPYTVEFPEEDEDM
ncbi:hypothetical protein PIB30_096373 [Stylosanthes scabra]|uniref:DUF4283 domain-containing protein n=1 Tax=Stylosanthes scabra TaxID=79078 RepID=A0ABU6TYH4_9FABA|nr:hypothetical protein [Stylosanthes scabra]